MTADRESLKAAILAVADPDKVSPLNGDMVTLFLHEVERLVESAIAAEREACAHLCAEQGDEWDSDAVVTEKNYAKHCAQAIRSRGTT